MKENSYPPVYRPDVPAERLNELRALGLYWPEEIPLSYMMLLQLLPDSIPFGNGKFYQLNVSPRYGISYAARGYTEEELAEEGMTGPNAGIYIVTSPCTRFCREDEKRYFEDCIFDTVYTLLNDKKFVFDDEYVYSRINDLFN